MYIQRKFNLIGGKIDFQYVSSAEVNPTNGKFLIGYDSKKEYAINLTEYQKRRVVSELNKLNVYYNIFESLTD